MRRSLTLAMTLTLGLSGCASFSQSNFNPANWFKSGRQKAPAVLYVPKPDNRLAVTQVLKLQLRRNQVGVIVTATGLPPTQGWWKAQLVKLDQPDASKVVYAFRVYPPPTPQPAGTTVSREITAAAFLTNVQLQGVKTIVVQGAKNSLSAHP